MSDLKNLARRASDSLPPEDVSYERLQARRDRKRRNARLGSAVVALVVAAGAIGGVAVALNLHGSQSPTGKDGPATGASNLAAGPGQYYYWKTVRVMSGGNVVEEAWWSEDGSGKLEAHSDNPDYNVPPSTTWGPGGELPGFPFESDLSGLSSDPTELAAQLRGRSASNGASPRPEVTLSPGLSMDTSVVWRAVTDLLEMGNATAPVRAAIFDVTAGLAGVETTEGVEDPAGRPAVSLSLALGEYYGGRTQTLFFDPATHLFMGESFSPPFDEPTSGDVIVTAGGIVDSRSETVAAGDGFFPAPSDPIPEPVPGG